MRASDLKSPETTNRVANKKLLLVAWGMPPGLSGSATVTNGLASQFSGDELFCVGEASHRDPKEDADRSQFAYLHRRMGVRGENKIRWLFLPWILLQLCLLQRRKKFDAIIAVYPNDFFLLCGLLLSLLFRKQFYSYFHNTYLEEKRGMNWLFAKFLQPRVFARSELVFTMSQGMADYYQSTYSDIRFEPLVHTTAHPIPETLPADQINDPLSVGFLGNINRSNSDAFTRFLKAIENQDIELTIYSRITEENLKRFGIDLDQLRIGSAPFGTEIACLQKHDILFLPHGLCGESMSEVEYQTIFPTKTISYLLAGRPIFSHCPRNSFLRKWLSDWQCAEIVDEPNLDLIRAALEGLRNSPVRRQQLVANGLKAVNTFEAKNVCDQLRLKLGMQPCSHSNNQ